MSGISLARQRAFAWLGGAVALPSRLADGAWLLFRVHLGLSIAIGAGWSKLVNLTTASELSKVLSGQSPAGPPDWFVQQVAHLGFTWPSPYLWALLAVWGEFAGGLLLALGLFTRFSALQLAVQFLVIAFFWYDAPEFLVGMYYQQLLFWAFVLVTFLGGGRYSLDYWLHQRAAQPARASGTTTPGRRWPWVAAAFLLLLPLTTTAQKPTPRLLMQDLTALAQQWPQGSLTYLDYSSQRSVTLATSLNGMQPTPNELVLDFIYQEPEGRQVTGYDKLRLTPDGRHLVWDNVPMQLQTLRRLPGQELRLVLVGEGQDDNRPCTLRRTLTLGPHQLTIAKEVRYAGTTAYLTRNTYRFRR